MRTLPSAMTALLAAGGPFIGDAAAPHGRVTIQDDWALHLIGGEATPSLTVPDPTKLPFRWWQRLDNGQTEIEVPNIKSIQWDRTIDADSGTCEIQLYNQWHFTNTTAGLTATLGDPGHFSFGHGNTEAATKWSQTANVWAERLIPNAMFRTYEGYGGKDKTVAQAVTDGNLVLTGVWLADTIKVGTDGIISIQCRDMGKLLIEQQIYKGFGPTTTDWYPLNYHRWTDTDTLYPGAPVYDSSAPIAYGPGAEGPKYVTDITLDPDGQGYWLVGTDGGVFSFESRFFGGRGGAANVDDGPMVSITAAPNGKGYWLCDSTGAVFAFGDIDFHGAPTQPTASVVVAMAAMPDSLGYYVLCRDGTVFNFGSATNLGNVTPANNAVDIAVTPSGLGFWVVDDHGHVYTKGDATYYGGTPTLTFGDFVVGMGVTDRVAGYLLATSKGAVFAYGDAQLRNASGNWGGGPGEPPTIVLNDPIFNIAATPTGLGYYLVGGDGGVYCFGGAPFLGSLPGDFIYSVRTDGNYLDYADIIKDLILWAGFHLYGTGDDTAYAWIEPTGAYAEIDPLPREMFDKKPVIDPINQLRETVGYIMYVDEAGAFVWRSPNFYQLGSLLEDGTRTTSIQVLDEKILITQYAIDASDGSVRSQITISSFDPDQTVAETVTSTRQIDSPMLRGMFKPAMWVNEHLTNKAEQETMLDRIIDHIHYATRKGTCVIQGHPGVQIDDQVRIYERVTADTYIHYVRGVSSQHDLDTGEWKMTVTTSWLGPDFP